MDVNRLAKTVCQAEAVMCEGRDYRGLSLGVLFRSWPQEVLSGRVVVKGKNKTAGNEVAKAYSKLCKVACELAEAVANVDGPQVEPQFARESTRSRRASAPAAMPALANSPFQQLPVSEALVPVGLSSQPDAALRSGDARQRLEFAFEKTALGAASGLVDASPAISVPGQHHCDRDRWTRVLQLADLVGVPATSLAHRIEGLRHSPTSPTWTWRRIAMWGFSLLVTVTFPRVAFRLIVLLFERLVASGVSATWRVATAVSDEAGVAHCTLGHYEGHTEGIPVLIRQPGDIDPYARCIECHGMILGVVEICRGCFGTMCMWCCQFCTRCQEVTCSNCLCSCHRVDSTNSTNGTEGVIGVCVAKPTTTPVPAPEVGQMVRSTALAAAAAAAQSMGEQSMAQGFDADIVARSNERSIVAAVLAAQTAVPVPVSAPSLTPSWTTAWTMPSWVIFGFGLFVNSRRWVVPTP